MATHTNQFTRVEIPIGAKFGKLTVLENVGHKNYLSSRIDYYKCSCECGKVKDIRRNHLLSGKTLSCGCHRRTINSKKPGEISYNSLYNICKHGAQDRNLQFSITKEQHRAIIVQKCHYCGRPPSYYNVSLRIDGSVRNQVAVEPLRAGIYANGVDRFDNSLGYILENCRPCCAACNRSKWEASEEEYIAHCRAVIAFQDTK